MPANGHQQENPEEIGLHFGNAFLSTAWQSNCLRLVVSSAAEGVGLEGAVNDDTRYRFPMFSKASFFPLMIASLSCFGQVTIISGTATTVGPSPAIAPLISTPDVALPASGSAVGAPLSSAAANDSRFSRRPAVYNPNGTEYVLPATSGAGIGTSPGAEPAKGRLRAASIVAWWEIRLDR